MMKNNLLLVLLTNILCLPIAQAQLLTEIQNAKTDTNTEVQKSKYYLVAGGSFRLELGNEQMRNFYEGQGFDDIYRLQDNIMLGGGLQLGDRFNVELIGELGTERDDRELSDGTEFSLTHSTLGLHGLLGYTVLEKKRENRPFQRLLVQAGLSGLAGIVNINEQRSGDFDFNNLNASDRPTVSNWPTFNHTQAALHFALQFKLSYPRPTLGSSDVDVKIGYVTGLQDRAWSVNPGRGINVPTDRAQYLYISSTYHFFFRKQR